MNKYTVEQIIDIISNFDQFNYKYFIIDKRGNFHFENEIPKRTKKLSIIDIAKYKKAFDSFDISRLLDKNKVESNVKDDLVQNAEILAQLSNLVDKLIDNNMRIPYGFAREVEEAGTLDNFTEDSNFSFFKSEFPTINEELEKYPESERVNFYKFANSLGCFRMELLKTSEGIKTTTLVAQKACSLLSNIIRSNVIPLRIF